MIKSKYIFSLIFCLSFGAILGFFVGQFIYASKLSNLQEDILSGQFSLSEQIFGFDIPCTPLGGRVEVSATKVNDTIYIWEEQENTGATYKVTAINKDLSAAQEIVTKSCP
jgi:hypothetical protein